MKKYNVRTYHPFVFCLSSIIILSILIAGIPTAGARVTIQDSSQGSQTVQAPVGSPSDTHLPWRDKTSPFGMVAALGNRVHNDEIDTAVMLMREAGVQWQREEIFWDRIQKRSGGPFIWDGDGSGLYNYDYAIRAQVEAGINILGLLDYNPYWFKGRNPSPDEWIDDWGDYVYATVARYGRDLGWIKYWELWNEPNLAGSGYESGLYEVRDFVRLLEVGNAAAKAADPEATIVMGGMASIWGEPPSPHNYDYFEYLDIVGELGGWDHVDIIAIHPYRPDSPEGDLERRQGAPTMDFRVELQHLDELLIRYGAKPVWLTEMGWSTNSIWPGVDEDTQAFFLVRSYLLAISHPSIEKVFWYTFRSDTIPEAPYESPVYNEYEVQFHFGLLRRHYPLSPNRPDLRKPAFLAYRTMTQMLGDVWLQEIISDGNNVEALPEIYWYRFVNNERRVDVLWRTGDSSPIMEVQCDCHEAIVRNWRGEIKHVLRTESDTIQLRLPHLGTPMYVEYDPPVRPGGRLFRTTGHTIRGGFLAFWQRYGGVERFGYPLTEEIIEPEAGTGIPRVVQYFDRARFEHIPEQDTHYEVRLNRIGEAALASKGIDWHALPRVSEAQTASECRFFAATGHRLCPPFRDKWEKFGALEFIGYPITEPFSETNPETGETRTVQYFERARLDYLPEHHGTHNEVQFGLLGRELIFRWQSMP